MRSARFSLLLIALGCGTSGAPTPPPSPLPASGPACAADAACPASPQPCQQHVCREGRCQLEPLRPGTIPAEGQRDGDCRRMICGVGGSLIARDDPADVPADDGNPCTREVCSDQRPERLPVPTGAPCGTGVCSASGECVGLVEIAAGRYHGCVRQGDGGVQCWGANERGQLGRDEAGGTTSTSLPVQGLPAASALALGGNHSCALAQQQVLCWGANEHGQLGDGTSVDHTAPVPLRSLTGASSLSAGLDTSCAVASGQVFCWGLGTAGQLGHGQRASSSLPVPVKLGTAPSSRGPVPRQAAPLQVAVGGDHACALLTGGQVRCWGNNLHGQLGDGTGNDHPGPAVRAEIDDATQLAAGRNHTCALRTDGSVWCWGWNNDGQLGSGDHAEHRKPHRVAGLTAVEIRAGNGHSCARQRDGHVLCWGWNSDGQSSPGQPGDVLTPTEIADLTARQLALGSKHTCALLQGGAFRCWGHDGRGQLGVTP